MNGEQPLVRIIDDEESIREALSFLLGNEGWKTIGYENADTFLRSDSPSTPGCVILDIRMPGMSGLDAQKIMKDRGFVLPIIFLSAHGDIDTIRCHTNFRHPFNLSWSGKTCDIRRSSKTTS